MILHEPIYLRSPRHVKVAGLAGQNTRVQLYCFNYPNSFPVAPTYTLEKPIPSALITENTYNIAPFIRRFIKFDAPLEVSTVAQTPDAHYCYCYVKVYVNGVLIDNLAGWTYKYICFDGFGYHQAGGNPTPPLSLMVEGTYYTEKTNGLGNMTVYNPDPSLSDMYIQWSHPDGFPAFSALLPKEVNNAPNVHPSLVSVGANVDIFQDGISIASYKFIPVCEPKYTPIKCDFVNQHGSWQRIVFFKASRSNLSVDMENYNMMTADVDYNQQDNITQSLNLNGNESITVNTGWVVENYSQTIAELMLSEHVKLDGKPVVLKSKSIEMQESINNKNINYKMEFNYAYSTLNYNS